MKNSFQHKVCVPVDGVILEGALFVPENPVSLVIFSHGSGSSRLSPRNNFVSRELQKEGIVTFLFDMLTFSEDKLPANRFNIDLLTSRLLKITHWLTHLPITRDYPIGFFGASTGAAAAMNAAAELPSAVQAVVCRGGRPDLAWDSIPMLSAPTMLIVGGHDSEVLKMNEEALARMNCESRLEVVEGATHLFEEPGALEEVARLAKIWFLQHLATPSKINKNTLFSVSS